MRTAVARATGRDFDDTHLGKFVVGLPGRRDKLPIMNVTVRAATLDDVDAVAGLLDAYLLTHFDRPIAPGEALDRLTRPDSGPIVAEDATGAMVGFGQCWRAGSVARCYAKVHPAAIGQGVGTALLSHLERRAQALGVNVINLMTQETDIAAPGLLRVRGYTEICHVLHMRADLRDYVPTYAPTPPGIEVAAFEHDRDAPPLFSAFRDAFPDDPAEEIEWWQERRENPALPFAPELWSVAREATEIVGFCLAGRRTEKEGTVGYVSDVGVRPAWRGQGIAFALLSACLASLAADGLAAATLNVDAENLTGALRLYRKVGMHPTPLSTEWSKPLLAINF